jgi:hypothetical protein
LIENDMSTPTAEPAKATARSPFAGCAIFICVVLMIVFLLVFSVFSFFKQYNAIAKFTDDKPAPVEITSIENREADLNALAVRLEAFRQDLLDDKETSISLTADDLNTALAAYEPLKDLRGTLRVLEITADHIRFATAFPLNGKPRLTHDNEPGLVTVDHRYLNGFITAKPELFEGEVVLQVSNLEVPGKIVAPEFTARITPYRISERYTTHPTIGPAMKKLSGAELTDGHLILRRKAGEKIPTVIDNKQVDAGTNRLFTVFGIAASVFLIFVAIVIFLGLRRKAPGA